MDIHAQIVKASKAKSHFHIVNRIRDRMGIKLNFCIDYCHWKILFLFLLCRQIKMMEIHKTFHSSQLSTNIFGLQIHYPKDHNLKLVVPTLPNGLLFWKDYWNWKQIIFRTFTYISVCLTNKVVSVVLSAKANDVIALPKWKMTPPLNVKLLW